MCAYNSVSYSTKEITAGSLPLDHRIILPLLLRGWFASSFWVIPKVSTNLSCIFFCKKPQKGSDLSALICALWRTVSFSRTDSSASTVSSCSHKLTAFRKSKLSLFLKDDFIHRYSVTPTSCHFSLPSVILFCDALQEAWQQMLKKN